MLSVESFTFSPVQENTFVVFNELKNAIIFDPGCYYHEEKNKLGNFIKSNNLNVVQLINTHCHLDHIFGNKWVAETYDVELFIHPNEVQVLAFGPQSGDKWGLPFENYKGPLHFINDGDCISLDEDTFDVLLTPGHSPGSLCFYNKEQQFIIGGDVLFRESIGRTDLPGGNHAALIESIQTRLFTLPDAVIIYPGHGISTNIGYEKQHNPFLN